MVLDAELAIQHPQRSGVLAHARLLLHLGAVVGIGLGLYRRLRVQQGGQAGLVTVGGGWRLRVRTPRRRDTSPARRRDRGSRPRRRSTAAAERRQRPLGVPRRRRVQMRVDHDGGLGSSRLQVFWARRVV